MLSVFRVFLQFVRPQEYVFLYELMQNRHLIGRLMMSLFISMSIDIKSIKSTIYLLAPPAFLEIIVN